MESTQLALLALILGAAIGGLVSTIIFAALRVRDRVTAQTNLEIPDGVAEVLSGMDDAAVVVDTSSTILASSPPAAPFGLVVGAVLPSEELKSIARSARTGEAAATATLRLRRGAPPAEPRLVVVRATHISARLTFLVLRDITEKERIEQMRRDFVSNTSHELKTPVGAVSLLSEAIESAADDPQQVRIFAARLTAEAARLASLTSRIMNLSRLQAADELNEERDVAVDEIVASAVEAHAVQADSAGVSIIRGGARGLWVRGDPQILSEAVGNLIANAISYSPIGSSVGVGVKSVDGIAEIAVADHGIGIPEGEQDRVFERFYRADQARSRRTGGTGLGLAIVKHAVQRHGGEVTLWSRPGRGSTFTIRLPLVEGPEADRPRKKRKKSRQEAALARPALAPAPAPARPAAPAPATPAVPAPATSPAASPVNGETA